MCVCVYVCIYYLLPNWALNLEALPHIMFNYLFNKLICSSVLFYSNINTTDISTSNSINNIANSKGNNAFKYINLKRINNEQIIKR